MTRPPKPARPQTPPPRIRLGMVGGGEGAFIGAVHRLAARLDDQYELVAGALSSEEARARRSGVQLRLAPDRIYSDYKTMARAEATRPDGIEAVAIVTPNDRHVPVAIAFIKAGIHVICDKPLSASLKEARALEKVLKAHPHVVFVLTHTYSAYPMVRQAQAMVQAGMLGTVRFVQANYVQGWLATPLEKTNQKQAAWRTDPKRSGAGGAIGDIGTHAFHLARFVTGLEPEALSADLTSFVVGRALDDNASVLLRFQGGAKGMVWASQVAAGIENDLTLRVLGTKGTLDWAQENPGRLIFSPLDGPCQILTRAGPGTLPSVATASRLPPGHPEGYYEAFATLYTEAAAAIRAAQNAPQKPVKTQTLPGLADGLSGMAFIEACVASSRHKGRWTKF